MTSQSVFPRTGVRAAAGDAGDVRDRCSAVVGLQWGDEGKGKIVDRLAEGYDVIVRYNGGANAGHSVQVGDQRFALHQLPSGIITEGKLSVIGGGVVLDPEGLFAEIEGLAERGVAVGDNLRISLRAHVVLPYHKAQDKLMEEAMRRTAVRGGEIGTTGRGIGPCYADKALRSTAIRVVDLVDPDRLAERLEHIVPLKNLILGALSEQCGQPFEPIDAAALSERYAEYGRRLAPHVCDTAPLLHGMIDDGKRVLFEGANATLLDVDHGTYPYVTSSNCSSLGVGTGTGVPASVIGGVLGVAKAYTTRVGGGPMPTELKDAMGDRIRERGNEYGTTTGRPRRCGWLDLPALRYSARISGATSLCLTMLDVLAGLGELRVCVGYRYRGDAVEGFPAAASELAEVEPVYEEVPGFEGPIDGCRRYEDLPAGARAYVAMVEEHTGVSARIISIGPRRDQTIDR